MKDASAGKRSFSNNAFTPTVEVEEEPYGVAWVEGELEREAGEVGKGEGFREGGGENKPVVDLC